MACSAGELAAVLAALAPVLSSWRVPYLNRGGFEGEGCRMDLPRPTTSVGTRTDYSVGLCDYPACATWHLMVWSTRTTKE
jgi:hypothetical protein